MALTVRTISVRRATALVLVALAVLVAARAAASPPHRYYVSLGDSLAVGMQPNPRGHDRPTSRGYADLLARRLADRRHKRLRPVPRLLAARRRRPTRRPRLRPGDRASQPHRRLALSPGWRARRRRRARVREHRPRPPDRARRPRHRAARGRG